MLGYVICYGRSVPSIGDQLFGKDDSLSDEEKTKKAQGVYDAVLDAFPNLKKLMSVSQRKARELGYTETILGRRRHHPDMQLPEFEFTPLKGYVNPDVDPLNPETLKNKDVIPKRVTDALLDEFKGYKYFGQIARRTKELYNEQHIKVTNNRPKITEASRAVVNCVDTETQILTVDGWRSYDQVNRGDAIYSYNPVSRKIEKDIIEEVLFYPSAKYGDHECYYLVDRRLNTVCTPNHRWVVFDETQQDDTLATTSVFFLNPYYSKLRVYNTGCDDIDYIPKSNIMQMFRTVQDVWCVTTGNHTWIAKRENVCYITGNSIIQGSAADLSKMAMLKIEGNETWNDMGARLINMVHDEMIAEAPSPYAEEAGNVLSSCMSEAGSFLPFPINCDVTTSFRWYGAELPCKYKKPDWFDFSQLKELSEDEIKWIQFHLFDLEYKLPVIKNENGEKPIGDAALGINGIVTPQLEQAILEYEGKYKIDDSQFIDHLYQTCEFGRIDPRIPIKTTPCNKES